MNIPTASEIMVAVNTPYSIRNLVPGPSVATTKFRARLFLPQNVSSSGWSYIAHCSVGIQSGNTSSTLATPVELTFNHMSGTALYPTKWEWTDSVDLPAAPGQNFLVTCDMNRPSPGGNYYIGYTNSGYGEWDTVNVANWNNAVMQGSVVYQSSRTHIIDRAQAW